MEGPGLPNSERSVWKSLPLHPQPQVLESFSSYVTRLAEANGLQSMNELAALVGAKRFRFDQRHPADYPYRLYIRLAEVAGCSLARLQSTTFFHLGEHFGMPSYSPLLHRFLRTSLAGSLRYCPCCLAQHALPYYSLIW